MLEIKNIVCRYGKVEAVKNVSLRVGQGEFVTIIGANGAGKSSTLKAISGLLPPSSGSIVFEGVDITRATPQRILSLGIAHCPEGRRVFGQMSVQENLELGAFRRNDKAGTAQDMQRIFESFPKLHDRRHQMAGTLSGGEQQMLAIGRALMSRPRLVLFDEPSLGLAPNIVQKTFEVIQRVRADGATVLMVEQNAYAALDMCDRAYLYESGAMTLQGTGAKLIDDPHVRKAYLGG